MTVILELLTASSEYLSSFDRFVQSAADRASLMPQNASIIPDSYTNLLPYSGKFWRGKTLANSKLTCIWQRKLNFGEFKPSPYFSQILQTIGG